MNAGAPGRLTRNRNSGEPAGHDPPPPKIHPRSAVVRRRERPGGAGRADERGRGRGGLVRRGVAGHTSVDLELEAAGRGKRDGESRARGRPPGEDLQERRRTRAPDEEPVLGGRTVLAARRRLEAHERGPIIRRGQRRRRAGRADERGRRRLRLPLRGVSARARPDLELVTARGGRREEEPVARTVRLDLDERRLPRRTSQVAVFRRRASAGGGRGEVDRALPVVRRGEGRGRARGRRERERGRVALVVGRVPDRARVHERLVAAGPRRRERNVRGTFLMSKACIPHLKKALNPHILNLSPPLNLNPEWFSKHLAYTLSKYGMSMIILGLAEELRPFRIAANALWPKTTIATAAVQNLLGGDFLMQRSRTAEIVADAAFFILQRRSFETSGQFFIDEEVLRSEGISDFTKYAVNPDQKLMMDLFL